MNISMETRGSGTGVRGTSWGLSPSSDAGVSQARWQRARLSAVDAETQEEGGNVLYFVNSPVNAC